MVDVTLADDDAYSKVVDTVADVDVSVVVVVVVVMIVVVVVVVHPRNLT